MAEKKAEQQQPALKVITEEAEKVVQQQEKPKELARAVLIKPGISGHAIKRVLPDGMEDATIDEVVKYALDKPDKRDGEHYADHIREEMKEKYDITVNKKPAKGNQKLAEFFTKKQTKAGVEYLEAEIVIAADEEGGLEHYTLYA